jgi:hypothetical protein
MPMKFEISSEFGAVEKIRDYAPHTGIDLVMSENTKLRPIVDGMVERVIHNNVIGHGVVIRGVDGTHHTYGHLNQISVKVGDHVTAGKTLLGFSGSTGNSTGPHLHYAIQNAKGMYIDPKPYMDQLSSVTGDISWWDAFWKSDTGQATNGAADWLWEKEVQIILKPIGLFFKQLGLHMWDWFVHNIPELWGYGAVLTGIAMILYAAAGRGMIKPIMVYGITLIIALVIKESVKG